MAFFLVDLEFREKARNLLTTKEIYLCIFFAVFALVSWSEVVNLLGKRERNADFLRPVNSYYTTNALKCANW
jgi:hypothetical protein